MKRNLAFYSILFIGFLLIQRGSGVLTKIVLANTISPSEYGLITLIAVTIPSALLIFSNLNFYQILSHSTEGRRYFGFTLVVSSFIMLIISLLLVLFAGPFFEYLNIPPTNQSLFIFVILLILWSSGILIDFQGYFTGLKLYSLPGIIISLPSIIRLIAVILLVFFDTVSLSSILLVFGISSLIPLVYILFKQRDLEFISLGKRLEIPNLKMLAFGMTIFLVSEIAVIGQYLVKIVVSHEIGLEWQGFFDVSLTLIALVIFGLATVGYVSIPEATGNRKERLYEKGGLTDITRLLFAFSLITTIIISIYGDSIVVWLFSEEYLPAADYVVILAIGYLFWFFHLLTMNINLASTEEIKDYLVYMMPSLILLPFFFILPRISIRFLQENGYGNGFFGAYFSFCIILIVLTCSTLALSKDRAPVRYLLKRSDRLGISLLIPLIIIALLDPNPPVGIILLLGTFVALVFSTGYLDKSLILDIFRTHSE